ncbi:leucyl-cystinyl aminopeptidase-like [Periplaneta americana]|uniref:leucyl-cystinyl aminopeptidase-like n=1 Tax=Periplaneta americana TaxID=6978 RepID=UPI0037E921C3
MVRQIVPLLALVSIVLAIDTQSMFTVPQEEQALPRTVKPYLYLLDLHPRISEGYFNGSVDIHIQCFEPTRIIVLHASYELQLENINLTAISTDYDYDVPAITEVARNGSTDTLNITLEEELTEGRVYRLHLEFHGLLKNNDYMYTSPSARGFFRDMYTDRETRETRWFAWTSTFPGFARHLFPCFDEPSFRAEFTVGVSHLTNMTVLTGWPSLLNKSTGEQGYVMEYFSRTYCIAPYSVGVLVAELDATEAMNVTSSQGTVELAVHHVRDNYESKVTELVPKVLQFLQDYLQTRFPVDKLDIVAMPITYFEMERDFPGLIMLSYFKFGDRDEDLYKDLVRQWLRHMVTLETWSAFNINELLTTYLTRYALSKTSNKQPELTGESRLTMYDQFATNIEDPSYFGYIPPYTTERGKLSLYFGKRQVLWHCS